MFARADSVNSGTVSLLGGRVCGLSTMCGPTVVRRDCRSGAKRKARQITKTWRALSVIHAQAAQPDLRSELRSFRFRRRTRSEAVSMAMRKEGSVRREDM